MRVDILNEMGEIVIEHNVVLADIIPCEMFRARLAATVDLIRTGQTFAHYRIDDGPGLTVLLVDRKYCAHNAATGTAPSVMTEACEEMPVTCNECGAALVALIWHKGGEVTFRTLETVNA